MKFALVDGQRQEAQPGLSSVCQTCDRPMVAKCGERRIWHWAHQARSACDPWWENETEWHRAWKSQFPEEWQEVILRAESGEKHIADVKTAGDWVLEFQHSYLKPEERRSRDAFYRKLIWVVNGTRRKTDLPRFFKALENARSAGSSPLVRIAFVEQSGLLSEWAGSPSPIFFDFGEEHLWWLISSVPNGSAYLSRFSRNRFVEIHSNGTTSEVAEFDALVESLQKFVAEYELDLQALALRQIAQPPLPGFQRYLARADRRRRRF